MKLIRTVLHFILNRCVLIGLLILAQIVLLSAGLLYLTSSFLYIYGTMIGLSALVSLWILNSPRYTPDIKLSWIIPIAFFPIFGGLFYLVFGIGYLGKSEKSYLKNLTETNRKYLLEKRGRENLPTSSHTDQISHTEQDENKPEKPSVKKGKAVNLPAKRAKSTKEKAPIPFSQVDKSVRRGPCRETTHRTLNPCAARDPQTKEEGIESLNVPHGKKEPKKQARASHTNAVTLSRGLL